MKKAKLKNNSQKGASLYIVVVITSIILAMTLGLETLLVSQLKGLREMGHSTIALFGADSGMEKILYLDAICQKSDCASSTANPNFWSLCCDQIKLAYSTTSCEELPCIGLYSTTTSSLPDEFTIPGLAYEALATTTFNGATTTYFRSKGIYKKSQREIEGSRPWSW